MTGKYANKTCVDCGIMRPANLMRRVSREFTGRIGAGISGSPFAGSSKKTWGSIRVSSGRKTVRSREVWVCGEKAACGDPDFYRRRAGLEATKKQEQKIDDLKNEMLNSIKVNNDLMELRLSQSKEKLLSNFKSTHSKIELKAKQKNKLTKKLKSAIKPFSISNISDGPFIADELKENIDQHFGLTAFLALIAFLASLTFFISWLLALLGWNPIQHISSNELGWYALAAFVVFFVLVQIDTSVNGYSGAKEDLKRVQEEFQQHVDAFNLTRETIRYDIYKQLSKDYAEHPLMDSAISRVFHGGVPSPQTKVKQKVPYKLSASTTMSDGINLSDKEKTKDAVQKIVESEDALSLITWIFAEKVMHSDGVIDESERNWFQEEFEIDERLMVAVCTVANDSRAIQLAVLMFNKMFPRHPKKRELLINNLFSLAVSDGELSVEEEKLIREIAVMIKMKESAYQEMLDSMKNNTNIKSPSALIAEDIFDELEELGDAEEFDLDR